MQYQNYLTDTNKYLNLIDSEIWNIKHTTCSELAETRALIDRIEQQDHYTLCSEIKQESADNELIITEENVC